MKKIYLLVLGTLFSINASVYAQTPTVADVKLGTDDGYPNELTPIGDKLWFFYEEEAMDYDDAPAYLKSNGEIVKLKWPAGYITDGWNYGFKEYNGVVYWSQYIEDVVNNDYFTALCMMRNDSVVIITNIDQDADSDFGFANNKVYFGAYSDTTGYALHSFDGNNIVLEDTSSSTYPYNFITHNGKVYFGSEDFSGNWMMSEITSTGQINLLANVGGNDDSNENGYLIDNQKMYYKKYNYLTGYYNLMVLDLNTNTVDTVNSIVNGGGIYINQFAKAGNDIYLTAYCNGAGTGYNTFILKLDQLNNNLISTMPNAIETYRMISYNDTLFFRAFNTSTFDIGFHYTVPGEDTAVFVLEGYANDFGIVANKLYVTFEDAVNYESEPYVWNNGSLDLFYDIYPGTNYSSYPFDYVEFEGLLAMVAGDNTYGEEIFFFCPTVPTPTAPATQIACEGSLVEDLTVTGNELMFFDADTLGNNIGSTEITASGSVWAESRLVVCKSDRVEVPFTISMLPNTIASHFGNGLIHVVNPTASYQWVDCSNGTPLAGETNQSLQITNNGAYQCILTNADGCEATTDCIYVVNLSVEENLKNNVSIYPNPASNVINLKSDEMMSTIQIIDLSGKLVNNTTVNAETFTVNTQDLVDGIYFISIYNTQNVLLSKQKLIVQK